MGTAAYMSPEQVRGEKVDARTDLFSFGLVFYEMATGKRAFTGETAPVLHDAILRLKPSPAREINARLPLKIESIIDKALQKDREARYQTAAQMRCDLEIVKREGSQRTHLAKAGLSPVVIAFLIVIAVFWFAKFRSSSLRPAQDLRLRQLTINSGENRVTSGAISPDGKYLAYSDRKGMHVKLIRSNEAETISMPKALENSAVDWQIVPEAWFPDSETFLPTLILRD
jgi:eukaryotic-like serine/threonine-protein kinase